MSREKPWREVVELAEHYLAIDYTKIHLFDRGNDDRPWEYVTQINEGNTVRGNNIRSDIRISAAHPCGITFEWWVELFKREENYGPAHQVDMNGLMLLLEHLPAHVRPQLRAHLQVTSAALLEHVHESMVWVDRERQQAEALYRLSTAEVPS